MSRFDAIGFGALNVDRLFKVNSIAEADGESYITNSTETCGGSAANTIVGLARLGCRVGFIGRVARDREGKMLTEEFCRENVDMRGISIAKQGRTGTVMGFVDGKGNRALYIDPGVNDEIKLDNMNKKYASETSFLHLTSFVGKRSFQTQEKIVAGLPESVKVSFDPGALYARKGFATLRKIVKRAYVALPNTGELELLTGKVGYRKGAKALLDEGTQIVAVKLGAKGCYVASKEENFLVESVKTRVTDTTGAGDAFDAGFLYGLIGGRSLRDCARIGNFIASRCIAAMGARTMLPALEDLKSKGLA